MISARSTPASSMWPSRASTETHQPSGVHGSPVIHETWPRNCARWTSASCGEKSRPNWLMWTWALKSTAVLLRRAGAVAVGIGEDVDADEAGMDDGAVRDAVGHVVGVPGAVRAGLAADREVDPAGEDHAPLGA